jgi:hypothetical protein
MLTLRQKFNLLGGKNMVRWYVATEYGDYPLDDRELWDIFTALLGRDIKRGVWIRTDDESQSVWIDGISLTADTINRIANTPGRDLSRYLRQLQKE